MVSVITFKYRLKDARSGKWLQELATQCNQVWNFCVATQRHAQYWRRSWPSAFDLIKLATGSTEFLSIHSDTVSAICRQFVHSRERNNRCPAFRASFGARAALGWIPYISRCLRIDNDAAVYRKRRLRFWKSRDVVGEFKCGAFVQDARGRWYVTFACEVPDDLQSKGPAIGIDLGLKALATLSDGRSIPAPQHFRQHETALAVAQRARKKSRARAIQAKIANSRGHHLHEQSTKIAREHSLIVVGNVNAAQLKRTKMAKSISDAGWSSFRHMLRYKAARRQAVYVEADERWSSQTCSACGTIPASSPKGRSALGIRRWECSDCGTSHDRDVNAARNILRVGLECQPPAGGISALN